jgi:hypothetical protein
MKGTSRLLVIAAVVGALVWLAAGPLGCSSDTTSPSEPIVEEPAPPGNPGSSEKSHAWERDEMSDSDDQR